MSWAPKYGLKGMVDASVRVIVGSDMNTANEKIMPLEFKSGKAPNGKVLYGNLSRYSVEILKLE